MKTLIVFAGRSGSTRELTRALKEAVGLVLCLVLALPGCAVIDGLRELQEMEIRTPADLAEIADGSYPGAWDAGIVRASVLVSVARGRISTVEIIEHECGRGEPAEAIADDVVLRQSLDVDTVSGATASSKTILRSIEVALSDAPREEHTGNGVEIHLRY